MSVVSENALLSMLYSSDDCDFLLFSANIILLQGYEIQQLLQPLLRTSSSLQTACAPPKVITINVT